MKPPFLYVICYVSLPVGNRHFLIAMGRIAQTITDGSYNKSATDTV